MKAMLTYCTRQIRDLARCFILQICANFLFVFRFLGRWERFFGSLTMVRMSQQCQDGTSSMARLDFAPGHRGLRVLPGSEHARAFWS